MFNSLFIKDWIFPLLKLIILRKLLFAMNLLKGSLGTELRLNPKNKSFSLRFFGIFFGNKIVLFM